LATVQVPEKAGQREATETADVKGKIVEYIWHLKKQGYRPATIRNYGGHVKHLVKLGADLFDPESVKETIATQTWKDGSKAQYVVAYEIFLEIVGLEWNPPRYKIRESLPFIPLTSELDALINSCGKKVACFLQGLKDTGADPGELAALEWTDLNFEAKSVTIKYPVKGHNPRVLPISNTFIGRLNAMPKKNARVFSTYRALLNNYAKQRQKIAHELSNPRILKIQFRTFRHWKGTMEYHLTRDPYHVKKILGHKRLSSTEIYINLEQALFTEADEGYHFKVAENVEEAGKLIEAGFEYVGRIHGSEVFRKRKSGQFDAQVVTFVQKPSQVETSPANSPSPSFFVFYVVKFFVTGRADDSAASEPNSFQEGRR
jgi:integrase